LERNADKILAHAILDDHYSLTPFLNKAGYIFMSQAGQPHLHCHQKSEAH
jgi:hypothetical protein